MLNWKESVWSIQLQTDPSLDGLYQGKSFDPFLWPTSPWSAVHRGQCFPLNTAGPKVLKIQKRSTVSQWIQ